MGQAHSIGLLHIWSYIAVLQQGQQERGGVSKQKKVGRRYMKLKKKKKKKNLWIKYTDELNIVKEQNNKEDKLRHDAVEE